ncbi:MAG TPA: hypothetical protein PK959_06520 [Candidatus Competibacteraceae bacterium]|nr:hypothetical protein [Candidatus Competibacteraceae bacterium]
MKLSDMSFAQKTILRFLFDNPDGMTRKQLITATPPTMPEGTVSSVLNRLCDGYGLVNRPEKLGDAWIINKDGKNLFASNLDPEKKKMEPNLNEMAETPPSPTPVAPVAPVQVKAEPDEPDEPEAKCTADDPIAAELLRAMEIEVALDQVRTRLRTPAIPAQAERVFRVILNSLPAPLVTALEPFTALLSDRWS